MGASSTASCASTRSRRTRTRRSPTRSRRRSSRDRRGGRQSGGWARGVVRASTLLSSEPAMASTVAPHARSAEPSTVSYAHAAGWAAIASASLGLLSAVAFLVLKSATLSALCLMLGALASTVVLVALRARVGAIAPLAAQWALLVAGLGALGAMAHGGFDLANALHPPAASNPDLPNAVDPRGLLTFGLSGLGTLVFAMLLLRDGRTPRALAWLGVLSAILSIGLYVGRLVVLNPANPLIALPALAEGFVVSPLWYVWLGVVLMRR